MAWNWNLRRRTSVLLVLGLVAVAGVLAYREYWLARPVGHGPAGPAVDRAAFNRIWTDRPVVLLGVGDSITAGLGARSSDHSYFNRLVRNPDDEYPEMRGLSLAEVLPDLTPRNLAVSGSTSLAHLETLTERLETHAPDVLGLVVMTTGGNDLIHYYGRMPPREGAMYGATIDQARPWIANFQKRLDKMLDLLNDRFPGGCHVFLADIYDPTDGAGDAPSVYLPTWPDGTAIHAAYNEVIHSCAKQRKNVHLVPLHREFLGHGSHCRQFWRSTYRREDPHYWFFENIEDPNDRGYDAIRRVFLNEIASASELISANDQPPK